jgi:hypothetical protein
MGPTPPPAVLTSICRPATPTHLATPCGLIEARPRARVAHHWSAHPSRSRPLTTIEASKCSGCGDVSDVLMRGVMRGAQVRVAEVERVPSAESRPRPALGKARRSGRRPPFARSRRSVLTRERRPPSVHRRSRWTCAPGTPPQVAALALDRPTRRSHLARWAFSARPPPSSPSARIRRARRRHHQLQRHRLRRKVIRPIAQPSRATRFPSAAARCE